MPSNNGPFNFRIIGRIRDGLAPRAPISSRSIALLYDAHDRIEAAGEKLREASQDLEAVSPEDQDELGLNTSTLATQLPIEEVESALDSLREHLRDAGLGS